MTTTTYFERLEREKNTLARYGLSCPPTTTELAEMLCELSDKLDALAAAEGWSFKRDHRDRWHVFPGRDAS